MSEEYREFISSDPDLKPISERQLGDRLKKIAVTPEKQRRLFFRYFPNLSGQRVISAGRMMSRAAGPVRHKKSEEKGIIPEGVDNCRSYCDGFGS